MAAAGTRQGQGGRRQNEVSEIPDCLADGHRGDRLQQGQSDALKEEAVVSRHKRGRRHCGPGRAGQGRAGGAAPGRARAAAGRAGGGFPQGTTAACGAPCRDPVGAPSESGPAAPGGHLRGRKFPANSPPVVWKTPAGGGGGAGGAVRAAPRLASPALGPAGGHPARRFARLETGIPLVMTHACDRTL